LHKAIQEAAALLILQPKSDSLTDLWGGCWGVGAVRWTKELPLRLLNAISVLNTSGVVKAGSGRARARPKFVQYMYARALVLLAQWLSVQQVPIPMTWLRHCWILHHLSSCSEN